MVLELTGADFSSNNIGKIDTGLSTWGEAVAQLQQKYTDDSDEMLAYDIFRRALSETGVLNKIEALYVPAMGSNMADSFVNLADETPTLKTTSGNSQGMVIKGTNGGLVTTATALNDYNNSFLSLPISATSRSNSTMFVATVGSGNINGGYQIGLGDRYGGIQSYKRVQGGVYTKVAYWDGTASHTATRTNTTYADDGLISFATNNGTTIKLSGNAIDAVVNNDSTSLSTSTSLLLYGGCYGTMQNCSMVLFGLSKVALTDAEVLIIQTAYEEFAAVMGW